MTLHSGSKCYFRYEHVFTPLQNEHRRVGHINLTKQAIIFTIYYTSCILYVCIYTITAKYARRPRQDMRSETVKVGTFNVTFWFTRSIYHIHMYLATRDTSLRKRSYSWSSFMSHPDPECNQGLCIKRNTVGNACTRDEYFWVVHVLNQESANLPGRQMCSSILVLLMKLPRLPYSVSMHVPLL